MKKLRSYLQFIGNNLLTHSLMFGCVIVCGLLAVCRSSANALSNDLTYYTPLLDESIYVEIEYGQDENSAHIEDITNFPISVNSGDYLLGLHYSHQGQYPVGNYQPVIPVENYNYYVLTSTLYLGDSFNYNNFCVDNELQYTLVELNYQLAYEDNNNVYLSSLFNQYPESVYCVLGNNQVDIAANFNVAYGNYVVKGFALYSVVFNFSNDLGTPSNYSWYLSDQVQSSDNVIYYGLEEYTPNLDNGISHDLNYSEYSTGTITCDSSGENCHIYFEDSGNLDVWFEFRPDEHQVAVFTWVSSVVDRFNSALSWLPEDDNNDSACHITGNIKPPTIIDDNDNINDNSNWIVVDWDICDNYQKREDIRQALDIPIKIITGLAVIGMGFWCFNLMVKVIHQFAGISFDSTDSFIEWLPEYHSSSGIQRDKSKRRH